MKHLSACVASNQRALALLNAPQVVERTAGIQILSKYGKKLRYPKLFGKIWHLKKLNSKEYELTFSTFRPKQIPPQTMHGDNKMAHCLPLFLISN